MPIENAAEAAVVSELAVYGASNIQEVVGFFNNEGSLEPTVLDTKNDFDAHINQYEFDFADVKGQENIKRALRLLHPEGIM